MRLLCTIVLLVLLAPVQSAWGKEVTFHATGDGFSISLPAGWLQIPRAEIDKTADAVSSAVPRAQPLIPSYAFQYAHAGAWFNYPYILITVRRGGRPPEAALRKLAGRSFTASETREIQDKVAKLMSEVSLGQAIFDESTKTVWLYIGSRVSGYGQISGVLVMIPTSYGIIQVQGYAKQKAFKLFLTQFVRMIDSVRLDENAKY